MTHNSQRTTVKRSEIEQLRKTFREELQKASESEVMTSEAVINELWDDIVQSLDAGKTIPAIAEALSRSGMMPKAASIAIMLRDKRKQLETESASISGSGKRRSAFKAKDNGNASRKTAKAESAIDAKSKTAESGAKISDLAPTYQDDRTQPSAGRPSSEEEF